MNDKIGNILRRAEAIIFDSDDLALRKFMETYYVVIDLNSPSDEFVDVILYTEKFSPVPNEWKNIKYLWSKRVLPETLKEKFEIDNIIESANFRDEYVLRFLSQCSV